MKSYHVSWEQWRYRSRQLEGDNDTGTDGA